MTRKPWGQTGLVHVEADTMGNLFFDINLVPVASLVSGVLHSTKGTNANERKGLQEIRAGHMEREGGHKNMEDDTRQGAKEKREMARRLEAYKAANSTT